MTKYISVIISMALLTPMYGQYISGTSYPDTTQPLVQDSSDLSFKYANSITEQDLEAHLTVLASDTFEGRETGEKGNEMAAQYLADYFESIGLAKPANYEDYFQDVAFTFTRWNNVDLSVNGKKFKHLWDYLAVPTANGHLPNYQTEEVLFLGYGIGDPVYNDYKGKNVKGKAIMIYSGDPKDQEGKSRITGTSQISSWSTQRKLELAYQNGAAFVFVIEADIKKFLEDNRRQILGGSMELGDKRTEKTTRPNHAYISTTVAKEIMNKQLKKTIKSRDRITKKGKSCLVKIKSDIDVKMDQNRTVLLSQNVLGFLEGTDKKDEIVVVSAHYDHIGKKGKDIFNGADDNGTGSCALLELAQAFKIAKDNGDGPRRSILFLLVTGEEKGLLGSEYYASNPAYELNNTMVDVNIDMIGRIDDRHDHANYIYVIGSDRLSSDLHRINEEINQRYTQMQLDYTYNDENDPNRYYYRSDHYNFAKNGIPSVFFFSGVHEDYHRPSDTIEKILFNKYTRTSKHIFHLIWDLSNRNEKIVVDGEVK